MERPQTIINNAAARLDAASYSPKKLVLIHSGVALIFSLVLTIVNYLIVNGIDSTGGLSGLGTRAILGTIQTVLQYANLLLLPFWHMGFFSAVLAIVRKQKVEPQTLLGGFRRIFPVLGLIFAQSMLALVLLFALVYICTAGYLLTPMAQPLLDILAPAMEKANLLSSTQLVLDEATMMAATEAMTPLLIFVFALFFLVMIPVSYHFRMANFVLMDDGYCSGIRALVASVKLMRHNCMALFRLDLRFWWYYGLAVLSLLLGYADSILPYLGVELPVNADVAFFLFYLIYLLAQLALALGAKATVQVSYGLVYEQLKQSVTQPKPVQQAPKKMPWDYE